MSDVIETYEVLRDKGVLIKELTYFDMVDVLRFSTRGVHLKITFTDGYTMFILHDLKDFTKRYSESRPDIIFIPGPGSN
jgi:hypothetical protein